MKENWLRQVCLQQKRLTPKGTRVMTKSKSGMQTVTNGHVGQKGDELCCWRMFQHQRPDIVSNIEA